MVKKDTNSTKPLLIGQRIRNARLSRGLTQQGLSMLTGMTVTAISGLENSRRPTPRFDTVERLSDALGINLMDTEVKANSPSAKSLKSLDKFLSSEMARLLKIKKDEAQELHSMAFFTNGEKVEEIDWVDWVRLRRKIRTQSK